MNRPFMLTAWVFVSLGLGLTQFTGCSRAIPQTVSPGYAAQSKVAVASSGGSNKRAVQAEIYGDVGLGAWVNPNINPEPLPNDLSCVIIDPNGNTDYTECYTEYLENQIGRTFAYHLHYPWFGNRTNTFPAQGGNSAEDADFAHGRIPVESWNCLYSNASVAAGSHDDVLNAEAQRLAQWGHPIVVRYFGK